MIERPDRRRLLAVSLKAYLGFSATLDWLNELRGRLLSAPVACEVELAVLPSYPLLDRAARELGPLGVSIGAQDVSRFDLGPYTGEVPASVLAEIGCRYAEVGHADRRRLLGEGDETIRAKVSVATRHGLIPLICVGECEYMSPRAAAAEVARQAGAILSSPQDHEVVLAYEPAWAIGSSSPAASDHVLQVGRALRDHLAESGRPARLLYGGTAGAGTLSPLSAEYDGLFLGRRAHQINDLFAAINEASLLSRVPPRLGATR